MKKYIFSALICFSLCVSGALVHGMEGQLKGKQDKELGDIGVYCTDIPREDPDIQIVVGSEPKLMKKIFDRGMTLYCFEGMGDPITLSGMRRKKRTGRFKDMDETFFQGFGSSPGKHGIWLVIDAGKWRALQNSGDSFLLWRSRKDFDWMLNFLKKFKQSYQGDLRLKRVEKKTRRVTRERFNPVAVRDEEYTVCESYEEEKETRRETLSEFIKAIEIVRDCQRNICDSAKREGWKKKVENCCGPTFVFGCLGALGIGVIFVLLGGAMGFLCIIVLIRAAAA